MVNMYNLNESMHHLNTAEAASLPLAPPEAECLIPKTPEIINSLIAITSPLDEYMNLNKTTTGENTNSYDNEGDVVKCGGAREEQQNAIVIACGKNSSNQRRSETAFLSSPTTVQNMCSQLIKEGLKLTLQKKQRNNNNNDNNNCQLNNNNDQQISCEYIAAAPVNSQNKEPTYVNKCLQQWDKSSEGDESSLDTDDETNVTGSEIGLTLEDEERRRRRRERNKIAATKCRLKKREKAVTLVQESELLENQNHNLKSQIQELEVQKKKLVDMLTGHNHVCFKRPENDNDNNRFCLDSILDVDNSDNENDCYSLKLLSTDGNQLQQKFTIDNDNRHPPENIAETSIDHCHINKNQNAVETNNSNSLTVIHNFDHIHI